jgi:hypothetical protein
MLARVKLALMLSTSDFDNELNGLISSAIKDLNIAGVNGDPVTEQTTDEIVIRAIITYVCYQFELLYGDQNRAKNLKVSYDEQKAQLSMSTGYTVWS